MMSIRSLEPVACSSCLCALTFASLLAYALQGVAIRVRVWFDVICSCGQCLDHVACVLGVGFDAYGLCLLRDCFWFRFAVHMQLPVALLVLPSACLL